MRWKNWECKDRKELTMTNRDYLMGLSNEKLAEVIWSGNDKICDFMVTYGCKGRSCMECIKEWLGMERKSNVEKGQIRQADSGRCYLIFMVTDGTKCLIIDEKGAISIRLNSVVETWTIRKDISIDEFAERIFNNL